MRRSSPYSPGESLPRPLLAVGVPCAGVLLVAFFLIRGFPYDELGARIASALERRHGIQLLFGEIGPALQLAGPAAEARPLTARMPDGSALAFDRALVRLAWSLSWLVGEPALHVEVDGAAGSASGTLSWNGTTSWRGVIRNARADEGPIADWIPTGRLVGALDAKLELETGESGLEGFAEFTVRNGTLALPDLSVPLPFDELTGVVDLGGDAYANLSSLRFAGPAASGSGTGKIGRAQPIEQAPIGFELDLQLEPALAEAVRAAGVPVDAQGIAKARIAGTVAAPEIR